MLHLYQQKNDAFFNHWCHLAAAAANTLLCHGTFEAKLPPVPFIHRLAEEAKPACFVTTQYNESTAHQI